MSFLRKCLWNNQIKRFILSHPNNGSTRNKSSFIYLQQIFTKPESDRIHYIKAFVLLFSGYLTYKTVNSKLTFIPHVNAATLFHNTQEPSQLAGRRAQFNFIADVVEKSAPAVVYIEIKDSRRVDFFTGRPLTISNGSGFIIEADGLIVTSAHVVTSKASAKVEVKLIDGTTYSGEVENVDLKSDLATVRIKAKNLPTMRLGNSSDLKPGEFVVAIGSPLALSNTVTSGVVSSAQRASDELGLRGKDMVYIQTDAAITFGNSGGPLVNLDGEAIGVNSMKVTPGISFAIPIDYVKDFLKQSRGGRKSADLPKKLYLGITMLTLTPQIMNELSQRHELMLPNDLKGGVLVYKVLIGSPAYSGGLQPGDIVTHIDGQPIKSANDVYTVLQQTKAKELKMSVSRHGRNINLIVVPEDMN